MEARADGRSHGGTYSDRWRNLAGRPWHSSRRMLNEQRTHEIWARHKTSSPDAVVSFSVFVEHDRTNKKQKTCANDSDGVMNEQSNENLFRLTFDNHHHAFHVANFTRHFQMRLVRPDLHETITRGDQECIGISDSFAANFRIDDIMRLLQFAIHHLRRQAVPNTDEQTDVYLFLMGTNRSRSEHRGHADFVTAMTLAFARVSVHMAFIHLEFYRRGNVDQREDEKRTNLWSDVMHGKQQETRVCVCEWGCKCG